MNELKFKECDQCINNGCDTIACKANLLRYAFYNTFDEIFPKLANKHKEQECNFFYRSEKYKFTPKDQ